MTAWRGRLGAAALMLATTLGPAAEAHEADIHHEIQARLDPGARDLRVTDVITTRGRDVLRFRLAEWLEVDSVALNGQPAAPERVTGGWRLALPDGKQHRVEVTYGGTIPPLPSSRGRGDLPSAAAGAEGAYLPGSAGWLPLTGDDWVTYRLQVETPAPQVPVATGRLAVEAGSEDTNIAVFVADDPAEPPSLFAGPYQVSERQAPGFRVRTYLHEELADLAAAYLEESSRYLEIFQLRIGPYPYSDFHVISAPIPVGLAFPNLTYVGRRVLRLPFMRGGPLAHEVLHNWWGNGVAVDYAGGNWSEGLTTYMADYGVAAAENPARAREMRLNWLRDYAALPRARDTPVTNFTAKAHDAAQVVGYNKVAFIFHMLKQEVGAADFEDALGIFWRRQRFRAAGWDDLRQAFETATGRELGWFFRQWLDRAGAPTLRLGPVEATSATGGHRVSVSLRQEPPYYRLTVPLLVETAEGTVNQAVALYGAEALVEIAAAARPLAVRVDPGHDLFRRLLPGEAPAILRDVTLAADTLTVIAAADEAVTEAAVGLARRLLDTEPRFARAKPTMLDPVPLLVLGTTAEVKAFLAESGLGAVPAALAGRGTARVWTARLASGQPLLAVAADDLEALKALLRPLPHYGRKSYLVFDGRRAVETGTWPTGESPLTRRLAP